MNWQPIETAPAEPYESDRDPQTIFVWVADGGIRGRGAIAFGYVYISTTGIRRPRANGYGGSHEWAITHWMPLPPPPGDKP